MARNRIIYASQSVWCNGEVLYRVQSLGSTTTFTSEDIFELGHLDIVDVVDDVPAVAVTLNTNDFGDVRTLAILAQVAAGEKRDMLMAPTSSGANLAVVDEYGAETGDYYHGVGLPDFAITCGNLTGVSLWAPVQDECSLGTLADNIDQTMWMDEVYINSLEFSYTTGANATENYGAETDQKMWLLNDGRFVNFEYLDVAAETQMTIATDGGNIVDLSDGTMGFLRRTLSGAPGVTWFNNTVGEAVNMEVEAGVASDAENYVYNSATDTLYFPTGANAPVAGDRVEVIYAADAYDSTTSNKYFEILDADDRPESVGALRQGQVEVYLIDPDETYAAGWEDAIAWRFTSATITSDLTREALTELGHLGPYDRPLTLPIPITVTMDTTAGDLEHWARFAGKLTEFESGDLDEIDLADLFGKDNLLLVVKVYAQTDEEAGGGTGADRKILGADNELIGQDYWYNSTMGTYIEDDQEYPLKTIVVEHLKITDEAYTLDLGSNATQTFGFRSTNDLYVVKGEVDLDDILSGNKIRRNG